MSGTRYTDLQMQRKYSMYRWGAGTAVTVLMIAIIITAVIIVTGFDSEDFENSGATLFISVGVAAGVLLLLGGLAFLVIELRRAQEMHEARRNFSELELEIRAQTSPSAPPLTLPRLPRAPPRPLLPESPPRPPLSEPPPYEENFHPASFWTARQQQQQRDAPQ